MPALMKWSLTMPLVVIRLKLEDGASVIERRDGETAEASGTSSDENVMATSKVKGK